MRSTECPSSYRCKQENLQCKAQHGIGQLRTVMEHFSLWLMLIGTFATELRPKDDFGIFAIFIFLTLIFDLSRSKM